MIGAAVFQNVIGADRRVAAIGRYDNFVIADGVLQKGVKATAKRVRLGKFPRPAPHRHARAGRLVGLVVADRAHAFGKAGGQQRQGNHATHADQRQIQNAPSGAAQFQQAEYCDTDQPGARLRADRHQDCRKRDADRKQPHHPARPEYRAIRRQPERQRDRADRHGRNDRAFVQPGIVVDEQLQFAIAATARQRLDRAVDRDHRNADDHDQYERLDPQARAQGKRQERRKDQRFPHPVPFRRRLYRKIGADRGDPAIDQQQQHQALATGQANARFVLSRGPHRHGQHECDQRNRQRPQRAPADFLWRDDIDIGVGEHEQERARKTRHEKRQHEGGQRQVGHGRRPVCRPILANHAASPCAAMRDRHPDRRATPGATRPARAQNAEWTRRAGRSCAGDTGSFGDPIWTRSG